MTKWEEQRLPAKVTIKAIDLLLTLFTNEEKKLLEIERNGQKVTLGEQFLARWWNHIPLADCPVVFRAAAMQKLEASKLFLDLLEKVSKDNLFAALLNPENYKEKHRKQTRSKSIDKREGVSASSSANVVKTLARSTYGNAALGGTFDYSKEWDISDRKRLDNLTIKTPDAAVTTKAEQQEGDDDHTDLIPKEGDEINEEFGKSIGKKERLDFKTIQDIPRPVVTTNFFDSKKEVPDEKQILLHTASIGHQANSTAGETGAASNTFMEALKRQNYDTLRERIILADALNNIQNLEFVDVREKFYKNFDSLFYLSKKLCL